MYIFFGLLTMATVILADFAINCLTDIQLHSCFFFFIIPLSLVEGALCSHGLFTAIKASNIKVEEKHYIIASIIGVICFISIHYLYYSSLSFDSSFKANYKFDGIHVSKVLRDYDFGDYLFYLLDSQDVTLTYGGHDISKPIHLGPGLTKVRVTLELLGFVLGSLAAGTTIIGSTLYCSECRKYYKSKKLYSFNLSSYKEEFEQLNLNINNFDNICDFIKSKTNTPIKEPQYIDVFIEYCPDCFNGILVLKHMYLDYQKHAKEKINSRQKILLNQTIARTIVE